MPKSKADRFENSLCFWVVGLVPLHMYLDLLHVTHGIDKGYGHSFPLRSYLLIGVYLLIVLTSDAFMLRYRRFELSKALRRYWGSAAVALATAMLLLRLGPERGGLAPLWLLLYAPYAVLVPLLEALGLSPYGPFSHASVAVVGGFCLLNWAICRFWTKKRMGL